MQLYALAGELSAPGLRELAQEHLALPRSDEEWRQYRFHQNEILDAALAHAVRELSAPLDPEPESENVRIVVQWDEDDAPFGVRVPDRYVLVPRDVYIEGLREAQILCDFLSELYGWCALSWWTA